MNWLKKLFCKHDYSVFVRNIYGDEINYTDKRSVWKCSKCDKYIGKDFLKKNAI